MPVAPSPLAASGDFFLPSGRVDFPVPRELEADEIPRIVEDFAHATRAAREAGFDGVELHGANGYLHDQFLQDVSNRRTDGYGGSIANRARLMLDTVDAMISAWSADRVGVRLSPSSSLYGMGDSDPLATFGHVVRELDARQIGYVTMLEPNAKEREKGVAIDDVAGTFRPMTSVPFITNTGYDKAKGDAVIADGKADLVAYGVPYIANPDLVERFRVDAPLNKPNPALFYGVGAEGYTDYPTMNEKAAA
jgi:N-ethylmaleimide reductase